MYMLVAQIKARSNISAKYQFTSNNTEGLSNFHIFYFFALIFQMIMNNTDIQEFSFSCPSPWIHDNFFIYLYRTHTVGISQESYQDNSNETWG